MTILHVKPKHYQKATAMMQDAADRDTGQKIAWLKFESPTGRAALLVLETMVLPLMFSACKDNGLTGPVAAKMIEDFTESYVDQLYRGGKAKEVAFRQQVAAAASAVTFE